MLNFSRAMLVLVLAAFVTTAPTVAQQPPAQMPAGMPMATKAPQGNPNRKCGQTPKGCHKNQPQNGAKKKCGQTPKGCHKNQPPNGSPPNAPPR
ncbi:MAG TPA: hypothetical protein VEW74_05290 [Candidatus Nitrosotalea sp.]|nr:hypothetical protein [Candidatus Nitrosotalea sp.]